MHQWIAKFLVFFFSIPLTYAEDTHFPVLLEFKKKNCAKGPLPVFDPILYRRKPFFSVSLQSKEDRDHFIKQKKEELREQYCLPINGQDKNMSKTCDIRLSFRSKAISDHEKPTQYHLDIFSFQCQQTVHCFMNDQEYKAYEKSIDKYIYEKYESEVESENYADLSLSERKNLIVIPKRCRQKF
jgi:hypothetical protein